MEYEKKVIKVGTSLGIYIPADLAKYIGLEEGSEIVVSDDKGKHGKFISFWRKDQDEK